MAVKEARGHIVGAPKGVGMAKVRRNELFRLVGLVELRFTYILHRNNTYLEP